VEAERSALQQRVDQLTAQLGGSAEPSSWESPLRTPTKVQSADDSPSSFSSPEAKMPSRESKLQEAEELVVMGLVELRTKLAAALRCITIQPHIRAK